MSALAPEESENSFKTSDLVKQSIKNCASILCRMPMQMRKDNFFKKNLRTDWTSPFLLSEILKMQGGKFFSLYRAGLTVRSSPMPAVRHLSSPIACTLDLGRSEDAEKSSLIAQHLGIKHLVFDTSENEIIKTVEQAPLLCQDFRDFNVHCAALNLLLAKNIRSWTDSNYPAVRRAKSLC